jgi:crossover junction endodeoxyribonuclease RuvC
MSTVVAAGTTASPLRILGIDPGLRITGFGVIECSTQGLVYVASGRVRSPDAGELPERLAVILDGLREVIEQHRPDCVSIEKVFVNTNPQSTLALGQARGTAICAAVLARRPVAEYTALQVKQAVVGHGHADKTQVQEMVRRLLGLAAAPGPDASDALACAICHAYAGEAAGALSAGRFRMRRGRVSL